mgnify:CR=1 FL=1
MHSHMAKHECPMARLSRAHPLPDQRRGDVKPHSVETIDLQLRLTILHIWGANPVNESFCAEVSVECRWLCPERNLQDALDEGLDQLDSNWEPEWSPSIGFHGTIDVQNEESFFWASQERREVQGESKDEPAGKSAGAVWLHGVRRFTVRVIQRFELHSFPFDVQDMNLLVFVYNAASIQPLPSWAGASRKVHALGGSRAVDKGNAWLGRLASRLPSLRQRTRGTPRGAHLSSRSQSDGGVPRHDAAEPMVSIECAGCQVATS